MQRVGLGILVGVVLGLVAGWLLFGGSESDSASSDGGLRETDSDPSPDSKSPSGNADQGRVQWLEENLAAERDLRTQLAAELKKLEARLASAPEEPTGVSDDPGDSGPIPITRGEGGEAGEPWFSTERLLALGMASHEIERIHARWEQYALDKLYLQHERARDDQPRKGGYFMRQLALDRQVEEELGAVGLDAMLYASGENNRVAITDVLDDSPAAQAGIRPGDRVIRYDDRSIFNAFVLKSATARGTQGELVEVWLLQDGEPRRLWLPRGPMGVKLEARSEPPILDR